MERALELGELERLKLENELRRSRRKCEELEATVARLLEEKRISNDREKKAKDRCEKISAEQSRISDKYQTLVLERNENVGELQRIKSEHDRISGICEEEFRCFDAMVSRFDGVIKRLEKEKSAAAKAVEELKLENIELRREKLEANAAAQPYKSSLEKLSSRMSRIEEELAGVLSIDLGDLATVANEMRELVTTEGSADSKGEDDGDSSLNPEVCADSKGEDDGDNSWNPEVSAASKGEDDGDNSWNPEVSADSKGEDNSDNSWNPEVSADSKGEDDSDNSWKPEVSADSKGEDGGDNSWNPEVSADSKGEDDCDNSWNPEVSAHSKDEDCDRNPEGSADSKGEDDDSSINAEDSADSKSEDDDSARNAENGIASSPEVGSPTLSARSSNHGFSEKDDRDMVRPPEIRQDADAHTFEDSPKAKSNECEEPLESGPNLDSKHLQSPSTKSARSFPAAAMTLIDIIDSDGETNLNGVTHVVPTPQTSKRNRTNSDDGLLTGKRRRGMCMEDMANAFPTHKKENQTSIGKEDSSVQKLSDASDEDFEEESLSDSKMIEMVKNIGKTRAYESMLQTIQEDDEFCMSAVCALYRQHISRSESEERPNSSTGGGISSFGIVRGLAKYLICGDEELRLRKSVSEVKKNNPVVIDDCRKLATGHAKRLFDLHWSAVDPFFRQS